MLGKTGGLRNLDYEGFHKNNRDNKPLPLKGWGAVIETEPLTKKPIRTVTINY